jgi:flagellar hook assembly protein FlgD
VYNILGQRIRSLVQGVHPAGQYTVTWDGKDEAGRTVESGVYLYRLETGSIALVKKMLMLK